MRVEGHLTPFRYLLGQILGTGVATILLANEVQGIITDIDVCITSLTTTTLATVKLQNNEIASLGASGFPVGFPISINQHGLFIPIYQNETLEIDAIGGGGDTTGFNVSGYLYSVQSAYGLDVMGAG